ncbi:hypothetical protein CALCODRAFT_495510 [Calocera cornea HHB12733]|uniref:Microbial-type PARG catalytic domain-containing protein n=1 Tax=Calocera cornea HHB12733 TaxID=1353952 RepID=A0A165GGA8_9BASI|nr:hypothetical protein CALCODRAFT_495510 [Calocera cornea HHB12733]
MSQNQSDDGPTVPTHQAPSDGGHQSSTPGSFPVMTLSMGQEIAADTLKILIDGIVRVPLAPGSDGRPRSQDYQIGRSVWALERNTQFLDADQSGVENWRHALADLKRKHAIYGGFLERRSNTKFECNTRTTLAAARHMHDTSGPPLHSARVGVLNCGNPIERGGGFLPEQVRSEASLVSSSTLYESMFSEQADKFYARHRNAMTYGVYTHAMIYSPGILIFRDDAGQLIEPYSVDIVTCAAINLAEMQAVDDEVVKKLVYEEMTERMARILWVFLSRGCRDLVLNPFGIGACQHSVTTIAKIWAELLVFSNSPFFATFDRIEFALPDVAEFSEFCAAFEAMLTGPLSMYSPRQE